MPPSLVIMHVNGILVRLTAAQKMSFSLLLFSCLRHGLITVFITIFAHCNADKILTLKTVNKTTKCRDFTVIFHVFKVCHDLAYSLSCYSCLAACHTVWAWDNVPIHCESSPCSSDELGCSASDFLVVFFDFFRSFEHHFHSGCCLKCASFTCSRSRHSQIHNSACYTVSTEAGNPSMGKHAVAVLLRSWQPPFTRVTSHCLPTFVIHGSCIS